MSIWVPFEKRELITSSDPEPPPAAAVWPPSYLAPLSSLPGLTAVATDWDSKPATAVTVSFPSPQLQLQLVNCPLSDPISQLQLV